MEVLIPRVYRILVAGWLLIGHGIPKLIAWITGTETWGPHYNFVPTNFFSGTAAFIEFLCPLMIIFGYKIKWATVPIILMFLTSAFSKPLPWFHVKVPVEGHAVPFGIIVSKEILIIYALVYLSVFLFVKDDPFWKVENV